MARVTPALLIAGAHAPDGQDAAHALTTRVAALLAGVVVRASPEPSLPDALAELTELGPVVVIPLTSDAAGEVAAWVERHPDADVRVAEGVDALGEVAVLVAAHYREVAAPPDPDAPVYLAGLVLHGRRVVVAGAGAVARRRLPALLAAGAAVEVVAPAACPEVGALAVSGALTWTRRPVAEGDLEGAWYVLAATDDPDANARVAAAAEARHIFCVRADAAAGGSAWTPATGSVGGLTVGVVAQRDPRRAAAARDAAVVALARLE